MNKFNFALAVSGTLLAAGAIAAVSDQLATADAVLVYACKDASGSLTLLRYGAAPACKRGQTVVSWNNEGPQGLPGEPGTNGTNGQDGQDGQPGVGVRLWRDANGDFIGPAVNFNYVEVTIAGIRTPVNLEAVRDANGALTTFGTFDWGGADSFTPRFSPNPDCSPPLYLPDGSFLRGYDVVAFDYHGPGPRVGETDLLVLSETTTMVDAACVISNDGISQFPTTFSGPLRTLVATVNLSTAYQPPFTLE
jgi:hypothetical protein